MTQSGLKPVLDPSSFFAESAASGTGAPAVCVTMEGTRPLLVEIQALCSEIQGGNENLMSSRELSNILLVIRLNTLG